MDIRPISSNAFSAATAAERGQSTPAPVQPMVATAAAPTQPQALVQQPSPVASHQQLSEAVEKINKALESQAQGLEFTMDDDTQQTVIRVVDRQTREVIRQIPSEETLEIAKSIDSFQSLRVRQQA